MSRCGSEDDSALMVEFQVVRQFARMLRLQARLLDAEGDHEEATLLRVRASRSERSMFGG